MNSVRRIDVIRHAESAHGPNRKIIGGRTIDLALSETGRQQAIALGRQYGPLSPSSQLLSSSALRAVNTAELAFPGHSVNIDDRLAETNRGIHEYLPVDTVKTPEFIDDQSRLGFDHKSPGGESQNEAADRFLQLLDEIERGNTVVAISHSRTIKAAIARVRRLTYEETQNREVIDIFNTSISRFENHGRGWDVVFFGRHAKDVPKG